MSMEKVDILMVDDRPQNILTLEAVLKNPEYNLIGVNSGEEALKCLLQRDFAVILLDVQMPSMNGFETAKLIKAREKSKNIPIIFITAINKASEHVLQGYAVGAVDYVFKPFDPRLLRLKISTFVELHKSHKRAEIHSKLLEQRTLEREKAYAHLVQVTSKLRKAEALARAIGDTSGDTVFTVDDKGVILDANPALVHMLGYQKNELRGRAVAQLFLDDSWNRLGTGTTDCENLIELPLFETVAVCKDNRLLPVDVQVGRASVENQDIYVVFIRDISERKLIEDERKRQYEILEKLVEERTCELRASEERFRRIFESSPNPVFIKRIRDNTYLGVNRIWRSQTGYSLEEIRDKEKDIFSFDQEIDLKQSLQNARVRYVTRKGQSREGLLSTELIEIDGEECILGVITDITERLLLEKELTRLDRLFLVGEMAAGIAHEIRNPMTTVHGFLQTLQGKVLSEEYVKLMLEELNRANSIITEFLSLARNKKSDFGIYNLSSIIDGLAPLIRAEALRQDKTLVLEMDNCQNLNLDEKEIRQMVLNLALNGLEAMSPGGTLTLKTYNSEGTVVLEVQDEGCGIKDEIIDKVGTPFFTTKDHGTGLGLAMCYSVAARHDAIMNFITGEEGTRFFIRFKLKSAQQDS